MSYKVLWLEDDINQILEAFQSLQSRGLHLTHVAKVSDAVNEVYHRHHDLDLVICDVMLPNTPSVVVPSDSGPQTLLTRYGYDAGLTFAQWVKREYPSINVVGVTIANPRLADTQWFLNEGDGYFRKGDFGPDFAERILNILQNIPVKQDPLPEHIDADKGIKMVSVLFLAADPTDASRLRLGEEAREIQEKLQLAKLREQFELHQRMSVRPTDISQALLDIQPQIVHFSGHGMTTGALCFENQMGNTHPIRPDALAALFEQFAKHVHCVLLNACYSEAQANAIAIHINYVIGMNQAIGDQAAIAFAIGFYQALGAGRTVEESYQLGCVQIELQGIPGHLTPVLVKKGQ